MAAQPTRRDRWLALGLLLAVITVAYLLLVHPWLTRPLLAIKADIAAVQERQQRVQAQLAQRGQIATQLRDVQTALEGRPGFLREATAESAAAALSSRLQDAVASASPGNRSCTISNRTPLPDASREPAFPRVALQVRLRCGVPEMAAVLHTLETGSPRLFVDNLNLLAQRFQQSPGETGTGLDVSFELVGYLRPGAALASGAAAPDPAPDQASLPLPAEQAADPGAATPVDAAEPAPEPDAAEEVEHEA